MYLIVYSIITNILTKLLV